MRHFLISGMSCAACSARVESAVSSVSGVDSCSVNLLTNSMSVEGSASDEIIIAAVVKAGYGATLKTDKKHINDNDSCQNDEQKRLISRLVASILLLVPLMYLSMGYVMWGFPLPSLLTENPLSIAILQLLICGAVLLINRRFFISGLRAVINKSPNMDTLVSLGATAALGSGLAPAFPIFTA